MDLSLDSVGEVVDGHEFDFSEVSHLHLRQIIAQLLPNLELGQVDGPVVIGRLSIKRICRSIPKGRPNDSFGMRFTGQTSR
jgi:hypothetical protein